MSSSAKAGAGREPGAGRDDEAGLDRRSGRATRRSASPVRNGRNRDDLLNDEVGRRSSNDALDVLDLVARDDEEVGRLGTYLAVDGVDQGYRFEALGVRALANVTGADAGVATEVMDAFVYLPKERFVMCELPGGELIQRS